MIKTKDHHNLEVNSKEQSCPFMSSHKNLVEEKQEENPYENKINARPFSI